MKKGVRLKVISALVLSAALIFWWAASVPKVSLPAFESKPSADQNPVSTSPEMEGMSERRRRMRGRLKQNAPDRFAMFHRAIRTRYGETVPAYPPNYQVIEWESARERAGIRFIAGKRSAVRNPLPWRERGPGNVAGRARSVVVDPSDPELKTWLVGSAGGGVWKTSDGGASWMELTADLPNLATTTLAVPRSNPDVIYAGTGEGFGSFSFVYGQGIWKSTDGGSIWRQVVSTADAPAFTNVLRLIVDPEDERIVVTATSGGSRQEADEESYLYRSEDGGATWQRTYTSNTRIEQVVANPDDFLEQYAAVNGKGVLKSIDGGRTWWASFEAFSGVGRIELAVAPSDPSRVYASVERAAFASTLFHSPNAGETWEILTDRDENNLDWLQNQGWYNNTVAVDPFDPSVVYVGGVDLMRFDVGDEVIELGVIDSVFENDPENLFSLDKAIGAPETAVRLNRLSQLSSSEFRAVEVRWGPGTKQKAHRFTGKWLEQYQDYVDVPFQVWDLGTSKQLMAAFEDTDKDLRWDISGALLNASERIFILAEPYDEFEPDERTKIDAFARAQYVLTVFSDDGEEIRHGPFPSASIQIHPEIRTFRTGSISRLSFGYGFAPDHPRGVHVDHHDLVLVPTPGGEDSFLLLDANDGGLAFSYDKGNSFTQTGDTFAQIDGGGGTTNRPVSGLNTAQFYGVDKMNDADRYIGGTQDNGSWIAPENPGPTDAWRYTPSGDGFESVWHYANPDLIVQSSQFNTLYRSRDGGLTWDDISPPGGGPFLTRIGRSAQRPDVLFVANISGLVRSPDFGASWEQVMLNNPWPADVNPTVRVSLATQDVVWAGGAMTDAHTLHVSTDGGDTFAPVARYERSLLGPVTDIATHPYQSHTAYALFSFARAPKILKTTDLGVSWEDITGFEQGGASQRDFPDVAVYSFLVMPFDENVLWAGTEIGLFESVDGGASWHYADSGLPAVAVWQMRIVNDQVVLATHGRGVWTVRLPELASYEPVDYTLPPVIQRIDGGIAGRFSMAVDLRAPYDSTRIFVNGEIIVVLESNDEPGQKHVDYRLETNERIEIEATAEGFRDGVAFPSAPKRGAAYPLKTPQTTFTSDFSADQDVFLLNGFAFAQPAGFANKGLHSPHPYDDFQDLTAVILVPIVVENLNSSLTFDEIVRVEAGEAGTEFGDPDFFDFVIVEASDDEGQTWKPLSDGYDARASAFWRPDLDVRHPPSAGEFESRSIDLLDAFPAGAEILIRFRLVSDNARTGWGWAIDNLRIQDALATPADGAPEAPVFALHPGYPNPFSTSTTISYTLPKAAAVSLQIFDMHGRLVRTLEMASERPAGMYSIEWGGDNQAGVQVASGVYFYRLKAGETYDASRRIVVVR